MAFLTYFFASGLAFFAGIACLLFALLWALCRRAGRHIASTIAGGIGLALVVLSGTPLPVWFYMLAVRAGTDQWILIRC